jgi:hypothetical protein
VGLRYRWEEEEAEKTMSVYSDCASEVDVLQWSWKEGTRMRVWDAYEFCLTVKPLGGQWGAGRKEKGREASDGSEVVGGGGKAGERFEGMEQGLAAVGFPNMPPPARRERGGTVDEAAVSVYGAGGTGVVEGLGAVPAFVWGE